MGCVETHPDIPGNTNLEEDLEYELSGIKLQNATVERADNVGLVAAENVTEEQFMATKPWIGALVAPTNKPAINDSPPDRQLTLQFINGFHVEDVRQNIYWSKPNNLIYPAAAVGVSMDVTTLKQRFMGAGNINSARGHTDDIMALGISPDRKWVVTGSLGAQPDIILWSADSMEIKNRTKLGRNTRAVSTIRFSKPDGKFIFCSDKHNDSNVYCFDTETLKPRASDKCGADPVIDAETGTDNRFACATKSGLWFFQYTEGQGIAKNRGVFGNNPRTAMSTVTFNSADKTFLSGSIDGFVYIWEGVSCTKVMKAHEGSVMAINWIDGLVYSSGSQDKTLKVWDSGVLSKSYELPSYAKSIDALNKKIVVGTKCGRIITIDGDAKKEVMHGHWTGETWGLAVGPDGLVYTSSDDNFILAFNPKTCRVEREGTINQVPGKKYKIGGASTLSLLPPNQQARGLAVSKAGHLAVGLNDGTLTIRTTTDLNNVIFKNNSSKEWIEVLKYSPDEKRLAVGSHDNNIYIFDVAGNNYTLKGALKGHNSFITQLDWSKDGRSMQSICGAYELLFWNVDNMSQLTNGGTQFRDQHWATYTVKLGWWVQGIFPPYCDGSHVNGVDRTKDEKVIVSADDWGLVNLYRNPCMKGAKANSYRAHSSHVVRALLDQNDSYLYSVGGYDKTLMMWKVS